MREVNYMPSGFKPMKHLGRYCAKISFRPASAELPAAWVGVLLGWGPTCYREGKTRGEAVSNIKLLLPRDASINWDLL